MGGKRQSKKRASRRERKAFKNTGKRGARRPDGRARAKPIRVKVDPAGSIYRWTFTYRETEHTGLATTPADAKRAGQKALREARHDYAWWCRWGSGETW